MSLHAQIRLKKVSLGRGAGWLAWGFQILKAAMSCVSASGPDPHVGQTSAYRDQQSDRPWSDRRKELAANPRNPGLRYGELASDPCSETGPPTSSPTQLHPAGFKLEARSDRKPHPDGDCAHDRKECGTDCLIRLLLPAYRRSLRARTRNASLVRQPRNPVAFAICIGHLQMWRCCAAKPDKVPAPDKGPNAALWLEALYSSPISKRSTNCRGTYLADMGGMSHSVTALGLFFLGLISCSNNDAPAEKTREQFCLDWAKAACSAETVSVCQASNAEACRVAQREVCEALVPTVGFSGKHADACIAAVSSAYADADLTAAEAKTVMRLGKPCDQLLRGPRSAGQTCSSNLDCNSPDGFDCIIKGSSLDGTCQTPIVKQPGLSCAAAQEVCTDGFYCNETNCVEGKAASEPCENAVECGAQGFCSASSECAARLAVSSPCTDDSECASDLCYQLGGSTAECLDRLRLSPSEPACDTLR